MYRQSSHELISPDPYSSSLLALLCPSRLPRVLLAVGGKGGRASSVPAPAAAIAATRAAAAAKADAPVQHVDVAYSAHTCFAVVPQANCSWSQDLTNGAGLEVAWLSPA